MSLLSSPRGAASCACRILLIAFPLLFGGASARPLLQVADGDSPPAAQPSKELPPPPAKSGTSGGEETPATILDGDRVQGILGKPVRSISGEDMGRIVDVIVDHARVRAAIIDFGGFLGVGSRQIAVDWSALRFPSDNKSEAISVDLTRDQLRVAPAYKAGEQIVLLGRPASQASQQQASPDSRGTEKPDDKPR